MIKKIISGGQTGVDQAALDVAIKLDIAHGGWIPRGRLTEKGPLPKKYHLQETAGSSYTERTEKNVLEAEGTVIIARGKLTGGSEYTRQMAARHTRPWLYIDLEQMSAFQAASAINEWVKLNKIEALNVAGPRESKDPAIYRDAFGIIESVFYLSLVESGMAAVGSDLDSAATPLHPPVPLTVKQAVSQLTKRISLKDKAIIANMSEDELPQLHATLEPFIVNNFELFSNNGELVKSCRQVSKTSIQNEQDAVRVIIHALWQTLQQTHKLRIIK